MGICGAANFNSHPREGGDQQPTPWQWISDISIPTPVKGVTLERYGIQVKEVYFNSHPREGGDFQPLPSRPW